MLLNIAIVDALRLTLSACLKCFLRDCEDGVLDDDKCFSVSSSHKPKPRSNQLKVLSWLIVPRNAPSRRYTSAFSMSTFPPRRIGPRYSTDLGFLAELLRFMGLPPRKSLKQGIMKSSDAFNRMLKCWRRTSNGSSPVFIFSPAPFKNALASRFGLTLALTHT